MPIAWYIVPYERDTDKPKGVILAWQHCAIKKYTKQIRDSGGALVKTEILGNRALVKVRASDTILAILNTKYKRLPKSRLDDSLIDLSQNVKTILKNELQDMGYSLFEIKDRFGDDLGQYTLRDVLKFMTKRRLKSRYDKETDTICKDGVVQKCSPSLEEIDNKVQ